MTAMRVEGVSNFGLREKETFGEGEIVAFNVPRG
jgi:hypothetical protein